MTNRLSVILPTYNGAEFLSESLNSIINQSSTPYEVIVIDDGSSDDCKSIVDKFPTFRYFRIENSGVAAARNLGIEKSSGDWIAFIDQDDIWTTDSLSNRLQFLEEHQDADIIIGRQKWFLHNLTLPPSWVKQEQMSNDLDGYLLGCALLRKSLFTRFGLFDVSFRFSSDFDWFFNLKDNGVTFYSIEQIILYKRIHEKNESRHTDLSLKELSKALFNSVKRKRAKATSIQFK